MFITIIFGLRKQFALYLSEKIGAPSEQIILIMTMAAAIPFSLFHYLIKGRTKRVLFSLIIGFTFHYSIYGINSLHSVFSTLFTYYFIYFFGRKLSPIYVLFYAFLHLSILNIHRMIFDFGGWAIDDISTIYMVFVAKFSSFAFSYADGGVPLSEIQDGHLKKQRIEEMPSLIEYASYIFFYPTCIIGPYIEFKDYMNWIEYKDCYSNLHQNLFFVFYQGCAKLFLGIFFTIFYAVFGDKYPMDFVGKAEFRQKYPSFWERILYMYLCGPVGRAKYYVAWLLTYSSLIFSGMAYGERIDKNSGQLIKHVDKGSYGSIIYNEFGMDPKIKMIYWNNSIHLWLKYNVFVRVRNSKGKYKDNKLVAGFCTYALSAIWHGFYPSYYVSFCIFYLFEQCAHFLHRIGFYKFVFAHKFMWPLISLKTSFFNNIIGSIFYCLEIGTTKQILINYKGLPVNVIVGFYVITLICNMTCLKKKKEKLVEKKDELIDKEIKQKKVE